jgi:hypothetical protein
MTGRRNWGSIACMGEIRNELMIRKSERKMQFERCNDKTDGNVKEIGSQEC